MAGLVGKYMKEQSMINFIEGATVDTILATPEGKKQVTYKFSDGTTK